MATKFKFEIESDGLTVNQAEAFSAFVQSLQAGASRQGLVLEPKFEACAEQPEPVQEAKEVEAPKRKRATKAKEVEDAQTEEAELTESVQAEEVEVSEPEEVKPTGYSLQDVRARVQEKIQHRAVIKDKLSELGAASVSLLDPSKFAEMVKFLDSL